MTTFKDKIPNEAVRLELMRKPQSAPNILVAIEGLRCHLDDQHQVILHKHRAVMDELEMIANELRARIQKEAVWNV